MKIRSPLGLLLACALGACATSSAGGSPPAPPPRLTAVAPEPPGITGVLSLCGFVIVGNEGELHFRMELSGERVAVRHGGTNDTYVVDGLLAQVSTIATNQISPTAPGLVGVELLRLHARFESARLSEAIGREVKPEEIEILASDNMPSALVWWFPGTGSEAAAGRGGDASEQGDEATLDAADPAAPSAAAQPERPTGLVYMTAAYGQRVLVLSVQGMHNEPKAALVAKAKAWMATVTTTPRPISARQVSAQIDAARAAGETCPGRANAVAEPQPAVPQPLPQQ
jgi:hypothetical protein